MFKKKKEYRHNRIILYVTHCSREGSDVKEAIRGK